GVFGFELITCLAGFFHLYGRVTFFALPALCIAACAVPTWRWARRVARHLPARRRTSAPGALSLAVVVFGIVGLVMVYFLILTPENIQFDSRWKHLALAEEFAVEGGIRRFPEGMSFAARTHFTSFLYTWAQLLPWG